MRANKLMWAALIAMCHLLAPSAQSATKAPDPWLRPEKVPFPPDNEPTPNRVNLGRSLFFDPRLSGSNFLSCASCHNPSLGWSDGMATGIGHDFKRLGRATPTILNAVYQPILMWDGRKPNLEAQALGPIEAAAEMNMPLDTLVKKLQDIRGYLTMFDKAYPGEGITKETIGKALASYERTIVSTTAPFDLWRKGDKKSMSEEARRGFEVFQNKGACVKCHQGFNFTDNGFHNIGVRSLGETEDEGRFAHRKVKILKGAFKTPTLRDVALTAPYMHNGIYQTLEEVIDHYDRGGDVKTNLSPNMQPLNLSAQEKKDLVAFMRSLTGKPMRVEVPHLPVN